jgi:hypothetical protein
VSVHESGAREYVAQPNDRTDLDVSVRTPMPHDWVLVGGASLNRSTLDRQTVLQLVGDAILAHRAAHVLPEVRLAQLHEWR